MENNQCGCEDIKQNKVTEKLEEDSGCGCGEETIKTLEEDEGCECGEDAIETPKKDEDCGCGTDNIDTQDDGGCGCGSIDYPDLSRVENPDKPKFTADEKFIEEFENYAHSLGISSVGYTLLTPDLLIKDKFVQYPFTIVLTMEMGKNIIETPPGEDAKELNDTAYVKLGILTTKLSDYLRKNGFATEIAHPYGGLVGFSRLAEKATLGYVGNNGLLITPELGPRVKISAIFTSITNLPVKEENKHSWIPGYCDKCGKCVKACPEKALIEKETCCGGNEVELVQKNCIGCSQGCTYCIEACPFEEKGYIQVKNKFDKMNVKLKEKLNKKYKTELWNNWAEENSQMFADLVNGATIAISMALNEKKLILLKKSDNGLDANIKDLSELKRPVADLIFITDEKNITKILDDNTSIKFIDLLSSGEMEVLGLISQTQLRDRGYKAFLKNLGLTMGGGGCCG